MSDLFPPHVFGKTVVVKGRSHQQGSRVVGTVIAVGSTVQKFGDTYFQVPALTLAYPQGVVVCPLQRELWDYEVTFATDEDMA